MDVRELMTGGRLLPITRWGTPVMHAPTRRVEAFDDDLRTLVRDMFTTMEAARGVGLAATQVGVDLAVFVYDCPDADDVFHQGVVCNPVVTLPEGDARRLVSDEEGCLSLPGGYQPLARPVFVYVSMAALQRPSVARFMDFYIAEGGALAQDVGYVPLGDRGYALVAEHFRRRTTGSVFEAGVSAVGLSIDDLLARER